ncbi:imidazoleglycerol-phosphate dehydratase HisB [Mariprofundus erugo]|uniref:Imidazoleglycerol-phosphate dehydratase n=1 Tax=Mariprofundus erugo TaxID=2528639 RepID=A0A5R9GUJ3_9PROT|nr:imidazoleglycerol-phosphate dehydratase HisB [Mariprofundus erugo]TLS69168.1 imidazoleglycerol-phosphate dehydratase HisB [Mariprofundus erugo]
MTRTASIERTTNETSVRLSLDLDGSGKAELNSSIPFLDHMLDQIARHGLIDLSVEAKGDREIDDHHTVEDIGICLGEALREAIGNKAGIVRYGHAYVPLDEALSRVVLDFSGRPGLEYHIAFPKETVGGFDIDLFKEFFQAVSNHARITLHIDTLRGANNHHIIETVFKAFGRALRMAIAPDARQGGIPSTKGAL